MKSKSSYGKKINTKLTIVIKEIKAACVSVKGTNSLELL